MIFSSVREFFSSTSRDERPQFAANSNGHDQTAEFRAFLIDNVRAVQDFDSGRDQVDSQSAQ